MQTRQLLLRERSDIWLVWGEGGPSGGLVWCKKTAAEA